MRTLNFKAQPTIRHHQSNVRQLLSASDYCRHCFIVLTVLNDLITVRSAVVRSRKEPPNIWLTVAKNARQKQGGNIWSILWLSQNVYSLCWTWKHSHRHFSQHIGYSEPENIRRIDIFVHVTCYPETMPMSRIVKKPRSIFKTKRSTELKTGQ